MKTVPYAPRNRQLPAPSLEAAFMLAAIAAAVMLLALLPYDDFSRVVLCLKFNAGFGCAN